MGGRLDRVSRPSLSAIHGLRDIFRVASEYAVESADPASVIRVSTWAVSATDDGPVMVCTSDTHPELAHRLSHVIIPPSLVVPELTASVGALTDWLVGLRSEGTTLCAVCAGVFVLADPPRRQQSLYQEFTPRLQHGDSDIREVQARLHACLHEPHSVEHLAQSAAMHPRTFQRRFKEATGLTATEYIQAARIAKARELLELTREPVAQISRGVGYLDVSNLRRLFQRATGVTGVTPSEYKVLARQAADHGNPLALYGLAVMREEAGDRESAEALAREAADHGSTSALYRLAELREEGGDRGSAETLAREAADHGDPLAMVRLKSSLLTTLWPNGLEPDGTPTPAWQPSAIPFGDSPSS